MARWDGMGVGGMGCAEPSRAQHNGERERERERVRDASDGKDGATPEPTVRT